MSTPLDDTVYFLRRFLRQPREIASICPSSRFLTARMFAGLELGVGDVLLEYGPGTGSFTVAVERMRAAGRDVRYLGIEKDPGMYRFLTRRFPDLEFVLGDAADVVDICAARELPRAAAVISGLPLILLEREVLSSIFAATVETLSPTGEFRTFSYVHSYPSPRAAELRELMERCFEQFDLGAPVLRNVPPALVLTGRCPRPAQAPEVLELALAEVPERGYPAD